MTEFIASFMNRQSEVVIFIQKINNGVYCVDIKGSDYLFQTYEGLYECIFELLENNFYLISNTSPVIEKMIEQYDKKIFVTDNKVIKNIQLWFEDI
jgi:hypothetical protein